MHTALLLSSTLLVVLGGYLALGILRRLDGWRRRRGAQVAVLVAPLASLGAGIGGVYHFAGRACVLGAPRWDRGLVLALLLGTGLVALGGLGLGLIRAALLNRAVERAGLPAPPELGAVIERLTHAFPVSRPRVLVCAYDRPLALVCGFRCPTILVSTWLVERLDRREIEAVLAHELAHVARRDYPVVWLATVLRDAFFYLPTSWAVYRQLQQEQELACDDLAVRATDRPLALASTLAKVWQGALDGQRFAGAQPLIGVGEPIERRIERLLTQSTPAIDIDTPRERGVVLGAGAAALAGLLAFGIASLVVMLAPMGCGPASALGRLVG